MTELVREKADRVERVAGRHLVRVLGVAVQPVHRHDRLEARRAAERRAEIEARKPDAVGVVADHPGRRERRRRAEPLVEAAGEVHGQELHRIVVRSIESLRHRRDVEDVVAALVRVEEGPIVLEHGDARRVGAVRRRLRGGERFTGAAHGQLERGLEARAARTRVGLRRNRGQRTGHGRGRRVESASGAPGHVRPGQGRREGGQAGRREGDRKHEAGEGGTHARSLAVGAGEWLTFRRALRRPLRSRRRGDRGRRLREGGVRFRG